MSLLLVNPSDFRLLCQDGAILETPRHFAKNLHFITPRPFSLRSMHTRRSAPDHKDLGDERTKSAGVHGRESEVPKSPRSSPEVLSFFGESIRVGGSGRETLGEFLRSVFPYSGGRFTSTGKPSFLFTASENFFKSTFSVNPLSSSRLNAYRSKSSIRS
jgi:hypothetical protein